MIDFAYSPQGKQYTPFDRFNLPPENVFDPTLISLEDLIERLEKQQEASTDDEHITLLLDPIVKDSLLRKTTSASSGHVNLMVVFSPHLFFHTLRTKYRIHILFVYVSFYLKLVLGLMWSSESLPPTTCPVCLLELQLNHDVTLRLACGHVLHYVCGASLHQSTCPLCRKPIMLQVTFQGIPRFEFKMQHVQPSSRYTFRQRSATLPTATQDDATIAIFHTSSDH